MTFLPYDEYSTRHVHLPTPQIHGLYIAPVSRSSSVFSGEVGGLRHFLEGCTVKYVIEADLAFVLGSLYRTRRLSW